MLDIQKNVSLIQYTTFKIGGPAKEFVVVKNEKELIEALQYVKNNNQKYYILGGGSNVLFDDRGFDGLIIKIGSEQNIAYRSQEEIVEAWAGENLSGIINFAKDNGLTGMENLAGIPGTIGGAARGNAGAFGVDMKNLIESVTALDVENFQINNYTSTECDFSYRNSIFKKNCKLIILAVKLKLQIGDKKEINRKIKEIIQKRNEKQPTGWVGCAGSFFENPVVKNKELIKKFEQATGLICRDNKIPAGWLIDEVDLRGKKIGKIKVSEKHSNFVINIGGGTAQEVVMLASFIKQQVRDKLGVELREEVQYVGY